MSTGGGVASVLRRAARRSGGSGATGTTGDAMAPRWRGQPGRLEVWYATLSDPASGIGCWIHHELAAPVAGGPSTYGWIALFRPDAPPVLERFGPVPVPAARPAGEYPSPEGTLFAPPRLAGSAGRVAWDLRWADPPGDGTHAPLFTFPAWAWEREVLPGAQVVPVPAAAFSGTLTLDGAARALSDGARGGVAHIYSHGSAQRWGWLHADLGDGDVLEVVSATSRAPGLGHLPPLAFVQLRLGGHDWPRDPALAAPLFRTQLGLPHWQVRGTVGRWRLRAEVTIPADAAVVLTYTDPDGSTATCTNSEVADAHIVLEHRQERWAVERTWTLSARAHAEIGTRP